LRPAPVQVFRVSLLVLLAFPPRGVGAEDPRQCPAVDPPAPASSSSLRAYRDPATGRLRAPTPEESRRLTEAARALLARRRARTYRVVVAPDGMKTVELDDAFDMSVIAIRQPDGSIRYRCVSGAGAAQEDR
jgi:hypothetical protein